MKIESLIETAAKMLKIIKKSPQPSDSLLSGFLREKKYIGSKERKFVSESIFASLRNLIFIESLIEFLKDKNDSEFEIDLNIDFTIIWLVNILALEYGIIPGYDAKHVLSKLNITDSTPVNNILYDIAKSKNLFTSDVLNNFTELVTSFSKDHLLKCRNNELYSCQVIYSMPVWIIEKLKQSSVDAFLYSESSLKPAPVFIRLSGNSKSREEVENFFNMSSIKWKKGILAPNCIELLQRAKIDDSEIYRKGMMEIQDEGSQMISYALAPEPNSYILDACAGAGGKSLHLASLIEDKGFIISSDTEYNKLIQLKKRAERHNFHSITTKHIKNPEYQEIRKIFNNKMFDYVLVDAPCSGMGTIRRDPIRKYRLNPDLLAKLSDKQLRILTIYSKFVDYGGILVYATCSVMPDENDDVVEKFLALNPDFEPEILMESFDKYNINIPFLKNNDWKLTLSPINYNGDGFFMARMKRKR
jgi:16S rRNA (cytosine967-C5)-methyltransferase